MKSKIIVSALVFTICCQFTNAQVTGPLSVEPNSTHRYEFDNGLVQILPSWVNSGGVEVTSGNTGTNYYVDVQWGGIGTGSVTFKDKKKVKGTLSNIIIAVPPIPPSGISNQNYIHSTSYRVKTLDGVNDDQSQVLSDDDKIEAVTYFDGLGRPRQSVGIRAGGNSEDIITHIGYDEYGRQDREYLPYTSDISTASYRTNAQDATNTYYDTAKYEEDFPGVLVNDINAFSEKELEASPLNRVLKQAAPGKDWKLGEGHEIAFEYQTNTLTEVRRFKVDLSFANNTYTPTLTLNASNYALGELYKTVTKDENYNITISTVAHTTEEFKDKQGRILLKRTYGTSVVGGVMQINTPHDTYYVYDKFGNLSYVLPPKIDAHTISINTINSQLNELGYQYKYDHRNRLVEKKVPGKGWESIIYDKLDQPIMTQDANMLAVNSGKTSDEWLFTKYDAFGRVVYTGLYHSNSTRESLQSTIDPYYISNPDKMVESAISTSTSISLDPTTTLYYTVDASFPLAIQKVYTINYYDNYTFDKVSGNSESAYDVTPITNPKGLATGSKVRVLGKNDWITTVSYYDDKSRPILVYNINDYLNYKDKTINKLDFSGNLLEATTYHFNNKIIIVEDYYTYDYANRLLSHKQKSCDFPAPEEYLPIYPELIVCNPEELIVLNTYDELGQLKDKKVGGTVAANIENSIGLQTVDYTYNIRGWLKQINNPSSLGNDLFSFKINYNTNNHGGTNLFNGNIAETEWKTANTDNSLKWYKYEYDALNRIKTGISDNGRYDLGGVTEPIDYDKNGNITFLRRQGHTVATPDASTSSHFGDMDNLTYNYEISSNKLVKVTDSGNDNYGFKDVNNSQNDYIYDANANLLSDVNKDIDSIIYNHLNLPTKVIFNQGTAYGNNYISYVYDATGMKLRKIVSEYFNIDRNKTSTTQYRGNFVYKESGSYRYDGQYWVGANVGHGMQFFSTSEGYVEPVSGSDGYDYIYQYKDHLGNIRLSYKDISTTSTPNLEILEENNYYPFGLKHKGYNGNVVGVDHKYGFGGKEEQDELGLNWIDITARNYDPALGRWMNLDPLAEMMRRHSPYNYAFDNPVYFIDPDGLAPFGSIDTPDLPSSSEEAHDMRRNSPFFNPNEIVYADSSGGGPGDPPTTYKGPSVAIGDNVVNQLDEVVVTASRKYDFSDDSNSDFTIYGDNRNGDIGGREGRPSHTINSSDIITPGGGGAGTNNPILKFIQYIQDLFGHQQNVQRAVESVEPTINNTDREIPTGNDTTYKVISYDSWTDGNRAGASIDSNKGNGWNKLQADSVQKILESNPYSNRLRLRDSVIIVPLNFEYK